MDHLGVEAVSTFSGDTHSLSLIWLAGILALVLAMSLISSRVLRLRTLAVRHLFLKIKIDLNGTQETGFVRALDLTGAQIVTSFEVSKGSTMTIDLSSLPDFPKAQPPAHARVKKVKALGGQPSNFLVEVKFEHAGNEQLSEPLSQYLQQLLA